MPRSTTTTSVRLSHAERRLIEAAAAQRGTGPSAYLRRVAVAAARRELSAPAEAKDLPPAA